MEKWGLGFNARIWHLVGTQTIAQFYLLQNLHAPSRARLIGLPLDADVKTESLNVLATASKNHLN